MEKQAAELFLHRQPHGEDLSPSPTFFWGGFVNYDCKKCVTREWWSEVCAIYVIVCFITAVVSLVLFIISADALTNVVEGQGTNPNIWTAISLVSSTGVILALTQLKLPWEIKCTHKEALS